MTQAEYNKLELQELLGEARLACQIEVEGDMALRPLHILRESGLHDQGQLQKRSLRQSPVD